MSGRQIHCNGSVKPPREGLITYQRKRARSVTPGALEEDASASITPSGSVGLQEDASASAAGEVFDKPWPKRRNRDIGWDHGGQVNGNKSSWRCTWCGIIRSGGVHSLKQHLVDASEVYKCSKVPKSIAETMRKHLNPGVLKAIDMINSHSPYIDDNVDKDHKHFDLNLCDGNASRRFKKCAQPFKVSEKWSRTATQRSMMDMGESVKEPIDTQLCTSIDGQDGVDRIDRHWRNILEQILQLPDITCGGGIQNCINNALKLGPTGFTRNFKVINISDDATEPKDRYEDHCQVQNQCQIPGSSADAASYIPKTGTCGLFDITNNTMKCQKAFLKILCSKKFALLCDLLCGSFQDRKTKEILDFSLINTKMKNGEYEQSPGLFEKDIRQVWDKFRKFGQEMFNLASMLSNMSLASFQKQVGEHLVCKAGEQKFEEACQIGVEQRNSMDSYTTTQFPIYESDRSTKPGQAEACCLYKVCTCKLCGTEADGKRSLICDGCEAMYHFSCIEPAVQEIPTRSWYCADCVTSRKEFPEPVTKTRGSSEPIIDGRKTPEPALKDIQQDRLHQNCVVCDRLEVCETQEHPNEIESRTMISIDSRDSSVSSMESDELPEPSRTAMLRLCKQCGTCEDDDKRFLICGNTQCPYKFYHIRCLKNSQIASLQQRNQPCWYCPSCLCRACLCDKDDDKIVLCDSCDEGYHTYCMKPPCTSIPKGQWYCISCNVARARDGMRRYEQFMLQRHGKEDVKQANGVNRPMDMLLSAAEKVSSEERAKVGRKDK